VPPNKNKGAGQKWKTKIEEKAWKVGKWFKPFRSQSAAVSACVGGLGWSRVALDGSGHYFVFNKTMLSTPQPECSPLSKALSPYPDIAGWKISNPHPQRFITKYNILCSAIKIGRVKCKNHVYNSNQLAAWIWVKRMSIRLMAWFMQLISRSIISGILLFY